MPRLVHLESGCSEYRKKCNCSLFAAILLNWALVSHPAPKWLVKLYMWNNFFLECCKMAGHVFISPLDKSSSNSSAPLGNGKCSKKCLRNERKEYESLTFSYLNETRFNKCTTFYLISTWLLHYLSGDLQPTTSLHRQIIHASYQLSKIGWTEHEYTTLFPIMNNGIQDGLELRCNSQPLHCRLQQPGFQVGAFKMWTTPCNSLRCI